MSAPVSRDAHRAGMPITSSPRPVASRGEPTAHLLVRLQHEWQHLRHCPTAVARATSWGLPVAPGTSPTIESLDDALRLTGYGVPSAGEHDDALRELVRWAAADPLAARVALQRMLPGISALARRRSGHGLSHVEVLDEVVASAWTVIRTYPVDRRRMWMALGMLREIDYQTFTRPRRRLATFVPRPQHTFDVRAAAQHQDPADELRELLDDARRAGVDASDLDLARRLARGDSTAQVAREMSVTDRTVRNRREVMTHRLRAVALAAS